jgi:opacity protein-like surface antigen
MRRYKAGVFMQERNKRMKKLILAVAISAVASGATAAQWETIGTNENFVVQLAVDSIKKSGSKRTFWQQRLYKGAQIVAGINTAYDSDMSRQIIDCAADTLTTTTTVYSLRNERVNFDDYLWTVVILPDSVAELLEKAVCK